MLSSILINGLIGDERLRDGSYPVLWLDPPDCPSKWQMTVSLLRNQFITHFQTLLHLGWFGFMFCSSGSSLLKKNPESFSHTWTAIWADASRLSPQSKFSEFIQLKWPFQFTEVTKIPSSSASFAIGRFICTWMHIYTQICTYIIHTHIHRICVCVCIKILLGISAVMFLSSVSI